ncbi:hypothetical protein HMPREF9946_00321 [Acetobacteraceae bacterium AT-5844]|nr:hypothetical protein HMPREF9946_00321 [Acetobacteraceae bacterium AT-5844]
MASNPTHGIDLEPVEERIADLRRKVETLMEERVTPAVSRAAGRAQDFAGQIGHTAQKEADTVATLVRERPFTSILLAAGLGYIFARLLGR